MVNRNQPPPHLNPQAQTLKGDSFDEQPQESFDDVAADAVSGGICGRNVEIITKLTESQPSMHKIVPLTAPTLADSALWHEILQLDPTCMVWAQAQYYHLGVVVLSVGARLGVISDQEATFVLKSPDGESLFEFHCIRGVCDRIAKVGERTMLAIANNAKAEILKQHGVL